MAERTAETQAAAAHEITKTQGGARAGSPWKPDYKPVPRTSSK